MSDGVAKSPNIGVPNYQKNRPAPSVVKRPRYERRLEVAYDTAQLRRLMKDADLEEWRLVSAMAEPVGLSFILIFEREL